MLGRFEKYLRNEGKSDNTVKSYIGHIKKYLDWYDKSYGTGFKKLYRTNLLDYISRMNTVEELNGKTINARISALIKLNEFLIDEGIQSDLVISKKDNIKIQSKAISPTEITKKDVEAFRQRILENQGIRNYTMITLMAYCGLRISETINIKINDFNLQTKELIVRTSKRNKQRVVYMNDKVINAIREYLKCRNVDSEYLFVSNRGNKINRTVINKAFNEYSNNITPHQLRHFFCTNALENEFTIHEVAAMAGHTNINTTMQYTHTNRNELINKMNRL